MSAEIAVPLQASLVISFHTPHTKSDPRVSRTLSVTAAYTAYGRESLCSPRSPSSW